MVYHEKKALPSFKKQLVAKKHSKKALCSLQWV